MRPSLIVIGVFFLKRRLRRGGLAAKGLPLLLGSPMALVCLNLAPGCLVLLDQVRDSPENVLFGSGRRLGLVLRLSGVQPPLPLGLPKLKLSHPLLEGLSLASFLSQGAIIDLARLIFAISRR